MKRHCETGILLAALIFAGSAQLSAQAPVSDLWPLVLIPNGETVYDVVNHVTWLTDANLPARQRFGIPLCDGTGPYGSFIVDPCVRASGIMDYPSAAAWILAMNNSNYLGHSNWQLPTTPTADPSCAGTGPNNSFGFGCNANALGYLYYKALGFHSQYCGSHPTQPGGSIPQFPTRSLLVEYDRWRRVDQRY
jgi:hypothetical protein